MKSLRVVILGWVILATTALVAAAQSERILSFDSQIRIHTNGTITVTETIQVEATGDQIKRGIYRDFPQLYGGKWGLRVKTGFEVQDVQRDGRAEPYRIEKRANGVRVYIGSPAVLLARGVYVYKLTYETDHQLGFFDTHDELYWNVTGNGWVFPIAQATATVIPPPGAAVRAMEAYTGPQGAKGKAFKARLVDGNASFETTRDLAPHDGLTIVVTWPKGFVTDSSAAGWWRVLMDNKGVAAACLGLFLVLVYYLIVWNAVGKDPKPGTIIPLYGPPLNFSPAAVRYLTRMRFDDTGFAAAVIGLAVQGQLKIQETGAKSYTLKRTKKEGSVLLPEESAVLQSFPADGSLELKQSEHAAVNEAKAALKKALTKALDNIYFVRNSQYWIPGLLFSLVPLGISLLDAREIGAALFILVWLTFWSVGVTALVSSAVSLWRSGSWLAAIPTSLFALPFLAGEVVGLGFLVHSTSYWIAGLFVAGICLNGIFYHLLKAPTRGGRAILDQIAGFKLYLSVAEKDRLNLENPPERTPQVFEQFLPYALALGVEQKWAEQFADVLARANQGESDYTPTWYSGRAWTTLGVAGFTSSLGSSLSGAISSASTAPGSSSGGGGGGSSGGGGGGGGGGGW